MPYSIRFDEPTLAQAQQGTIDAGQDERVETVYVTMSSQDPERRHSLEGMVNGVMRFLAVAVLLAFVLMPDAPVYTTKTLSVPAVLLPVQIITVSVPVTATGVKNYPATQARGVLTITNGGSLTESLQMEFLLTSGRGVEVATDQAVTIPAGNGQSYGVATVSAHAVMAGSSGNIPALSVNRTYGTDLFIKNLNTFTGGKDAYSVRYVTDKDKQTALASARAQVAAKQPLGLLLKPCTETTSQQSSQVNIMLTCQPISYHVPAGLKIVGVRVQGMRVVLTYRAIASIGR